MMNRLVYWVVIADLGFSANQKCWAEQAKMEAMLVRAVEGFGREVKRAHEFDAAKGHGFIDSQRMGLEVFRGIPKDASLIVAEAVWQYSHHLLPGLWTHTGPILTAANWSGTWPGLVGMLNLNGSLTKGGVSYSTLWSENFADRFFRDGLKEWLETGQVRHDLTHVRDFEMVKLNAEDEASGRKFARAFRERKAI